MPRAQEVYVLPVHKGTPSLPENKLLVQVLTWMVCILEYQLRRVSRRARQVILLPCVQSRAARRAPRALAVLRLAVSAAHRHLRARPFSVRLHCVALLRDVRLSAATAGLRLLGEAVSELRLAPEFGASQSDARQG